MSGRVILVVFALALALRLGYVALVHDDVRSLLQPDSQLYLTLGRDLIETGGFHRVTGLGVAPETERVPGYPAWLAAFRVLVGQDALWPVLGQAVIDAATCVLIALLAARLDRRLGALAGLLAALNLNMIAAAGVILTDSLFLALLTGWMLATVRLLDRPTALGAAVSGLLLGATTLVRATTQFMPPILAVVVLHGALRAGVRPARAMALAALALVASLAVLAPYGLRNYAEFGHFALTSQSGTHALYWVVPAAQEYARGVPFETAQREMALRRDLAFPIRSDNPFIESAHDMAVARTAMAELGLAGLAHAWAAGTAINLAAPSLFAVPPVQHLERPSFYATPGDGALDKAMNYVRASADPMVLILLGGGVLVTVVARLIQALGLIAARRALPTPPWLFLIGVAAYIVAVTGPVTGVKYCLPLEPLLTILLAFGLATLARRRRPGRRPGASAGRPATTPPTTRS